MNRDIEVIQEKIQQESLFLPRLLEEVGRVIVGQSAMVERLLIGLLADGHVLMEGVPGLAKTLTVKTLAQAVDGVYGAIGEGGVRFADMHFRRDIAKRALPGGAT